MTLNPEVVGKRAAEILADIQAHPNAERLRSSSMKYSGCWASFTGYPTVARWNLHTDAGPLLDEALKVLAIKAAIYDLTGDEVAAEILVAPAVDEMVHAVLAQSTVVFGLQFDLSIRFPHATELERFEYTTGCETDALYGAAGWGAPPLRYWLDKVEVERRLGILNDLYDEAGFGRDGRSHYLDFAAV